MRTTRTLAALVLTAGLGGSAAAQNRVEDILARKPVLPGVIVSTPTGAELAGCRVEPVSGQKSAEGRPLTGVAVRDAQGRLVRQILDDTGNPDLSRARFRSFYLNGVEAYREIDADSNGKPDQYRFLGPNGGRWGADTAQRGVLDRWFVLSPEEASQELFHALVTKDAARLQALLPTEDELKAAQVPADEIAKIMQRAAGVPRKVQELAAKLNLTDKDKWVHLELTAPFATAADPTSPTLGVMRHRSGTILVDRDGKVEQFQTGELVLVGSAWKLVDGPAAGQASPLAGDLGGPTVSLSPEAQALLGKINDIQPPQNPTPQAMAEFHAKRAVLLEQIVRKTQGAEQDPFIRQTLDALASVAEAEAVPDGKAMQRLIEWQKQIEAAKSPAAGYAAFRVASAEYAVRLAKAPAPDLLKVQDWWRGQLEAFVAKYPKDEETAEAMLRLAVANEFVSGKDGEKAAQNWYEKLAAQFPQHPHALKAQGAIRRLTSEGQPLQLPAATDLAGKPFNPASLGGKAVVVYYWATWGRDTTNELKLLGELLKANAGKLEVVTINLDEEAGKATAALNASGIPGGIHLHQPGGLERSPLAVAYGIQMVPHLILVGKDGKVANRNAQVGASLKDEVEKLVK